MKEKSTKKGSCKPLTKAQDRELAALADLPDNRIDTRDIPEQTDWNGARRGAFFRPVKQQLTLRLDADVVEWFRTHVAKGEGYQTRINSALRSYVARHEQSASKREDSTPRGIRARFTRRQML